MKVSTLRKTKNGVEGWEETLEKVKGSPSSEERGSLFDPQSASFWQAPAHRSLQL